MRSVRVHELAVGAAVEEEVGRPRDPDRGPAVHAQALHRRAQAGQLAHVLGAEVAAELGHQQAQARAAGTREAGPGGVRERQLAAREPASHVDAVRLAQRPRDERGEADPLARVREGHARAEVERALRRRGRELRAALDGRTLEAEEVEHRVAHAGDGGEHGPRGQQEDGERQHERAAQDRPARTAGLAQAGSDGGREVRGGGPVELLAETGQHPLELSHAPPRPARAASRGPATGAT